jgi:hypothetical protein
MRVAASHSRLRRVAKTVGMLILAVMIAAGTPDLGIAQTMSFSQPVTVLRGQPATPSNQADQADQSVPTAEAPYPNWYPYSYYYPYWWYAGPPWGWGWDAPWVWGWPVGVSVAFGGCFNCRFLPAFFHHHFFHPGFAHPAFIHPRFARPGFAHTGFTGFARPGFVHTGFRGGFSGGFHGGRR